MNRIFDERTQKEENGELFSNIWNFFRHSAWEEPALQPCRKCIHCLTIASEETKAECGRMAQWLRRLPSRREAVGSVPPAAPRRYCQPPPPPAPNRTLAFSVDRPIVSLLFLEYRMTTVFPRFPTNGISHAVGPSQSPPIPHSKGLGRHA